MGLMQPLGMNTAGLIELLVRADTADLFSGTDLDKSPVYVLVLAPRVPVAGLISDREITKGLFVLPIDLGYPLGKKTVAWLDLTEHNVAKLDRLWMQHRLEHDHISLVCMRPQRATRRLVYHWHSFLEFILHLGVSENLL